MPISPVRRPQLCHFPHSPCGYFQRRVYTPCLHCVDAYSPAFLAQLLFSSDLPVKRVSLRPHCHTCTAPLPALTHQASSHGAKGSPLLVSVSSLPTRPSHMSVGTVTSSSWSLLPTWASVIIQLLGVSKGTFSIPGPPLKPRARVQCMSHFSL